jgi:hypothetical protein
MPLLDPTEIQALVDRGEIHAFTLDTSIFDQFGCNLGYKSLASLGQFKGTNIRVLLSAITLGEVQAHIAKEVSAAADKMRAAHNQYLKAVRSERDRTRTAQELGLVTDAPAHAAVQVAAFVSAIGAVEVPVEPGVSVAELTRLYFAAEPPFSARDGKKGEYPDAIALLSLEAWATANSAMVLAVSKDGDWHSYAEKSPRIICVRDLAGGLNFFNTESSVVAARLAALIRAGTAPLLSRAIKGELERYIEDFEIEAQSDFMFDQDRESSEVTSWYLPERAPVDVVASDEETVTLSFEVAAEADFGAYFNFSVRDAIDGDYVTIGKCIARKTETFSVRVVATVPKEEDKDPEPFEVEVEGRRILVDFEYVGPDYHDD